MTPGETSYGTPYAETELFLAMAWGEMGEARCLLGEMLPGERAEMKRMCQRIIDEIDGVKGAF